MNIKPPFGYKDIVPLNRARKVRLLRPGELPEFARGLNSIPISYSEFARVEREYPIVFIPGQGSDSFSPVAVLGMATGENLYDAGGSWAKNVYVPAYVRRYPFCMAKVTLDKVEQQNRLICVERSFQDDNGGELMFDAKGQPPRNGRTSSACSRSTRSTWSARARCAASWPTRACSSRSPCRRSSTRKRAAPPSTSQACSASPRARSST
jgi:hypothetical protein